jgi:hypothetical protein
MEIQKELNQISLDITEEEYFNSEELHHSTLARYEKEGFAGLDHLFDKIESAALTRGSLLDVMLTGTKEDFEREFFIAEFPVLSEKPLQVVNMLFEQYHDVYAGFSAIPAVDIINAANIAEFQTNLRDDTRIKKLTEACSQYYNLKYLAGNRAIIDQKTYDKVAMMAEVVKESPATCGYFAPNDKLSPVRRYYQLMFKATVDGVGYIIKPDLLIVDYEKKEIIPVDLKSSGKPEYAFPDSFLYWRYDLQARLYWPILRANLDADPYFKNFTLLDFRFIVVNQDSLTPLDWEFPYTRTLMTLVDEKGNEYRSPFEIGKELKGYLNMRPQVPNGIDKDGINKITCLKLKEC